MHSRACSQLADEKLRKANRVPVDKIRASLNSGSLAAVTSGQAPGSSTPEDPEDVLYGYLFYKVNTECRMKLDCCD